MVSNARGGVKQAAASRASRGEHVGQAALVLGVIAFACAFFPLTREAAWVAALPAVVLALASLYAGRGRKRFAAAALVFGWFGFSYSFAMMIWG